MSDLPAEQNQEGLPAVNESHSEQSSTPNTQFLELMTSLARREPNTFQTLIQHFWSPEGADEFPVDVPPELISKAIENDSKQSERDHSFRQQALWVGLAGLTILLLFFFGCVWLMRDHVEFATKAFETIALIATHGAVAGGAYHYGKAKERNAEQDKTE